MKPRTLEEEMKKIDRMKRETSARIKEALIMAISKKMLNIMLRRAKLIVIKQLMQSHTPFRFVELDEIDTDEVGFGNKVSVLEEGRDKPEIYYLLGPIEFELDLYPMIVTYLSPFGQSMVGKEVNDYFILEIEGKDTKFTIQSIEKVEPPQS